MIKNYFLIAFRNLARQKGYSFINIFGLSIGITAALLIFLWVYDEISFDRFHENLDRLYRAEQDQFYGGESYHVNVTPYPSGEGWAQDIPEIEKSVRLAYTGTLLLSHDQKSFYESGLVAVDSSFFSVFTFPLIAGNPETVLTQPFSMVLTEELVRKYFGNEDPIGKSLKLDNKYDFTITGVMEDIPGNSSLSADIIIPFDFTKTIGMYNDHWGTNSIQTFVMLQKNTNPDPVDDKLTNVVKSHLDFDEGEDEKYRTRFMLSPVKDIHLHSYFGYGHPPGQIQNVIIFSTIGIFILIIAGINYMNLSTARSSRRAREIGLRKVVGARRKNLIFQFLGESLLTTIFATILSLIFVNLLLGKFNQLSGKEIEFSFLLTKEFVFGLIGVVFFTGILAGTYPALLLSRFLPVIVLKSATGDSSQRAWFRKGLVIVQFTLSIFLITGTLLVYKQLKHMQAEKLGYDKDHVFYVRMFGEINSSYSTIRDALKRNPEVINISASGHLPSNIGSNASGADWDGKDPEMRTLIGMSAIDFDYIETLKIPIIKGRSISREFPSDLANDSTGSWLVNEEVVKIMGVENPVGMRFSFSGVSQGRIVGVIKNFHFKSMRNEIEPLAIIAAPTQYLRFLLVRIGPGNIDQIMSQLEDSWKEVLPNYPFDYHFLDEDYEDMYRTEDRMGGLLKYFAFMSVFIASLGLFGLAAYMAETRTREIGIRKVFGSSISGVVYMMTGEFAKLVILAVVIGVPVSWYFLNNWLEDYAYRTSLSWWIFGLPALFSILVAIITVSFQALKAANKNPANTLRYE